MVISMDIQMIEIEEQERPAGKKRTLTAEERLRRKRRRRRVKMVRAAIAGMTFVLSLGAVFGIIKLADMLYGRTVHKDNVQTVQSGDIQTIGSQDNRKWRDFYAAELAVPELDVELLTVNEYSRPGIALPEVKNIFVHYTANAGTTALQNRSYFESLAETKERSASAHFIIDCDGSVVQCIPTKEIAYAVMKRNYDSISIECCYENENGEFTEATYESLIRLTAWLVHKFRLEPEDVLRHYDEGGKNCPKYYVENKGSWERFLYDLEKYMKSII